MSCTVTLATISVTPAYFYASVSLWIGRAGVETYLAKTSDGDAVRAFTIHMTNHNIGAVGLKSLRVTVSAPYIKET